MTARLTEHDARALVVASCRRLVTTGLVYGTAGNVSVRIGDHIFISPSGVSYDAMTPEMVCVVDMDGTAHHRDFTAPSSETPLHLELYRTTDALAIAHAHSAATVAAGLVTDEIPPIHYMIRQFGGPVRVADYATFGSDELASNVSDAIRNRTAALMRNHGAVTLAGHPEVAVERCVQLEWLCDVYLRAKAAGEPRELDVSELDVVAAAAATKGYRL